MGYRFATYATWWIRQAINRAVVRATPTRDPAAGGGELALKALWMIQVFGREPTPEGLAAELDPPRSWSTRREPT